MDDHDFEDFYFLHMGSALIAATNIHRNIITASQLGIVTGVATIRMDNLTIAVMAADLLDAMFAELKRRQSKERS